MPPPVLLVLAAAAGRVDDNNGDDGAGRSGRRVVVAVPVRVGALVPPELGALVSAVPCRAPGVRPPAEPCWPRAVGALVLSPPPPLLEEVRDVGDRGPD